MFKLLLFKLNITTTIKLINNIKAKSYLFENDDSNPDILFIYQLL